MALLNRFRLLVAAATLSIPLTASGQTQSLQAEDLFHDGVRTETAHSGFTGSGYANFIRASGARIAFHMEGGAGGTAEFEFRYALGGRASRTLAVSVAGREVGRFAIPGTRGWNRWETHTIDVPVNAGRNLVVLTTVGQDGPNIDRIDIAVDSNVAGVDIPVTLEAENLELTGAIVNNGNRGFNGAGYVNYTARTGGDIEFSFNSDSNQTVTLDMRYALGGILSRDLAVEVNGSINQFIYFPGTIGWTRWNHATIEVQAVRGTNTVALVTTGEEGPNIDQISIRENDLTPQRYEVVNSLQPIVDNGFAFHDNDTNAIDNRIRTIEIRNTTNRNNVTITSLSTTGPFSLMDTSLASGRRLSAGQSLFVDVAFDSLGFVQDTADERQYDGGLVIQSNDRDVPVLEVKLQGAFTGTGGASELFFDGQLNVFDIALSPDGFQPTIPQLAIGGTPPLLPGEPTARVNGRDERAFFFEAANPNQPVMIQQIAAMHNPGGSSLSLQLYDYNGGPVNSFGSYSNERNGGILIHDEAWFNTILAPERNTNGTVHTVDVDTQGRPFSPRVNSSTVGPQRDGDFNVYVFEVYHERTGELIEDVLLVAYDFAGGARASDFNDNTFLINNVQVFNP